MDVIKYLLKKSTFIIFNAILKFKNLFYNFSDLINDKLAYVNAQKPSDLSVYVSTITLSTNINTAFTLISE